MYILFISLKVFEITFCFFYYIPVFIYKFWKGAQGVKIRIPSFFP